MLHLTETNMVELEIVDSTIVINMKKVKSNYRVIQIHLLICLLLIVCLVLDITNARSKKHYTLHMQDITNTRHNKP